VAPAELAVAPAALAGAPAALAAAGPWPAAAPWAAVVVLGAVVALALEPAAGELSGGRRAARAAAVVALAAAALAAVWCAWAPVPAAARALPTAAAWWLVALPALGLAALASGPAGAVASARLAVTQATPAIFHSFAALPAVGPLATFSAGFVRAAAPPFHSMATEAAGALPAGAAGLLLAAGLALGGPAAIGAPLAGGTLAARLLIGALALAVGIAGVASAADRDLMRRLAKWASVQAGIAILLALLPEAELGAPPAARAAAHLGASAAALPLLFLGLGRVALLAGTADLAAHSGLLACARRRGTLVMILPIVVVAAGARAPLALAAALAATTGNAVLTAALAGWVGSGLGLLLAGYRMARGEPRPGRRTPPELRAGEVLLVGLCLAAAVAAALLPSLWAGTPR